MIKIYSLIFILIGIPGLFAFAQDAYKALKVDQAAPDFILEDAYGNEFKLSDKQGKTLILAISATSNDKEERQRRFQENKEWIEAIKKKYNDKVVLIGMARLDVNPFLKSFARKKIRETHSIPFVIDWKGNVYKDYSDTDLPTMVLIDKHGIIRHIIVGSYSAEAAATLFNKIDVVLNK